MRKQSKHSRKQAPRSPAAYEAMEPRVLMSATILEGPLANPAPAEPPAAIEVANDGGQLANGAVLTSNENSISSRFDDIDIVHVVAPGADAVGGKEDKEFSAPQPANAVFAIRHTMPRVDGMLLRPVGGHGDLPSQASLCDNENIIDFALETVWGDPAQGVLQLDGPLVEAMGVEVAHRPGQGIFDGDTGWAGSAAGPAFLPDLRPLGFTIDSRPEVRDFAVCAFMETSPGDMYRLSGPVERIIGILIAL